MDLKLKAKGTSMSGIFCRINKGANEFLQASRVGEKSLVLILESQRYLPFVPRERPALTTLSLLPSFSSGR